MKVENNRSPYVRDYDYNNIGNENEKNRFNNLDELNWYLDKVFIPKNIAYKKISGKSSGEERCLSIQFNKIVGLKCSNEETYYILKYLSDRDIYVGGFVSTLEGEFDNYDYKHKYKLSPYPDCMSSDEQKILFEKLELYKKNNDVRKNDIVKKIAEGCLRLIPYITYKYSLFTGIDINEFNSYGCEGLIKAIDKFESSRGCKFSTFAYPYIKCSVNNGLRELRGFNNDRTFYSEFIRCRTAVLNGYREDADVEVTIYDEPQILEDIVSLMVETYNLSKKMESNLRRRINIIYHYSYEECEGLICDCDMEEDFIEKDKIEYLWKIIELLPARERDVVFKRFGFNDEKILTLDEIGNLYGVTKERIRQIENRVISRFRDYDCLK